MSEGRRKETLDICEEMRWLDDKGTNAGVVVPYRTLEGASRWSFGSQRHVTPLAAFLLERLGVELGHREAT